MSVQVEPGAGAGRAVIRVPGAAGARDAPGFRIQREDYDEGTLGPSGWQASDAVLRPERAEASGGDLLLHAGWAVCQHLEAGVYLFALPAAGVGPEAVFWPDIAPVHAGAVDVFGPLAAGGAAAGGTAGGTVDGTVGGTGKRAGVGDGGLGPDASGTGVAEVPVGPGPERDAGVRRGRGLLVGLLGLLVLLALGGGAWWVLRPRPPGLTAQVSPTPPVTPPAPPPTPPPASSPPVTPPPVTPPPVTPPPVAPSPGPPQLGGLSVPDVIAQAADPGAIAAEGTRRLQGNRRDDGLLLLEAAADRGDGGASAALGRLYDPVLFQPGGAIPRPDARQAARYYRDAARGGADVAGAREALKRSLEAKSQGGDLGANLTLKDFWP